MRKVLSVFLSFTILLSLAACSNKENASNILGANPAPTIPTEPSLPEIPQKEMSQSELELALCETDLSALCAGFAAVKHQGQVENHDLKFFQQVCYYDYNADGIPDVLIGGYDIFNYTFSVTPQRTALYDVSRYGEGFNHYYSDNQGNLYRYSGYSDWGDYEKNGKLYFETSFADSYELYENGAWNVVYVYMGYTVKTMAEDGQSFVEVERCVDGYINDEKVTEKELDDHLESIGMTYVQTQAEEFTSNTYDLAYKDSLLRELDVYFRNQYPGYSGAHTVDLDNDGQNETVFFLPEIDDVWYQSLTGDDYSYTSVMPKDLSLNCFVVADTQRDNLVIDAYAISKRIDYYADIPLKMNNCFLMVGNQAVYTNNMAQQSDVPASLSTYLSTFGFEDCVMRKVDVTDLEEDEYLFLANKDGTWYMLLIVLKNGNPYPVYSTSLENAAIYLTEQDGKECLMVYEQSVYRLSNGINCTNYNYNLIRFDVDGNENRLVSNSVTYRDTDTDGTKVAAFFKELNTYIIKIIVVYDPYMLTGKQWIDPSNIQYGTAPEIFQETPEDAVMGIVQIQDPASWLNLREGPGTEYRQVLVDPTNPESYVRQAQGSPVTVLETIETGDPKNPVWVKVRIVYANQEFVGYSSKAYIRIIEE